MASPGIYVHVPFCSAICNYCNFNRGLLDEALKRRYVNALVRDIERQSRRVPADTIYFGGGTPSLLDPAEIGRIIDACRASFDLARDTEITLEANPETVSMDRLEGFRAAGCNRISLGVQSFRDDELRRLGRLHDAARAREAIAMARAIGVDNISLDLMMWLPGQDVDRWIESVDALIGLRPEHASLYLLEIYPNAPLRDEMARGGWTVAPDDLAAEMYETAFRRLEAAGYEHYEISNVSLPGRRSHHNVKYWTDVDWQAFGCGAHGRVEGVRWRNVSGTLEYVERVEARTDPAAERHRLSRTEQLAEALFMGLRLVEGVSLNGLRARYQVDVMGAYGQALTPYLEAGLVELDAGRLRLSRRGFLLANEIMAVFV